MLVNKKVNGLHTVLSDHMCSALLSPNYRIVRTLTRLPILSVRAVVYQHASKIY